LKKYGTMRPQNASQQRHTYSVPGRTISILAVEVEGRPVVVLVNVPAGVSIDLLNLTKITLHE
jgi:hypothetical protein